MWHGLLVGLDTFKSNPNTTKNHKICTENTKYSWFDLAHYPTILPIAFGVPFSLS